jgi:hypothetical protein
MKWCFNFCLAALILLPAKSVFARDVILIESLAGQEQGLLLRKILTGKFQFPEKLITLRIITTGCETKSDAIVHLCLLPSGDLQVLKMNEYVVKNSFGIFLNRTKNAGAENNE